MLFLGHDIGLNCLHFRSDLFSANGTILCQPRVERREELEHRGTLGEETKIELKALTGNAVEHFCQGNGDSFEAYIQARSASE